MLAQSAPVQSIQTVKTVSDLQTVPVSISVVIRKPIPDIYRELSEDWEELVLNLRVQGPTFFNDIEQQLSAYPGFIWDGRFSLYNSLEEF